jgi:hypothetical protein
VDFAHHGTLGQFLTFKVIIMRIIYCLYVLLVMLLVTFVIIRFNLIL